MKSKSKLIVFLKGCLSILSFIPFFLQGQGMYPPPQGMYPPQQGMYPPPQGMYSPTQGMYPPLGMYPPPQGMYTPPQGMYPPPQGMYPPTQGIYPPSMRSLPPFPANPAISEPVLPPEFPMPPNPFGPQPTGPMEVDNTFQPSEEDVETDRISEILDFWFGPLQDPAYFPENKLPIWFSSYPDIDRQIRNAFSEDLINIEKGDYDSWRDTPRGRLALIILLDQIPRRLYRNKPQSFTFDRMAKAIVLEGMQKGDDKELYPIERAFYYLPLEHSEELYLQNLSVSSFQQLLLDSPEPMKPFIGDFLQSAIKHQQQIARFGRFPHRNFILGRESTPEETVFLMQWSRG